MALYTPFSGGESAFNAANANSRLLELQTAILNSVASSNWGIIVPFTQLADATTLIDIQNIPSTYKHLNLKLQIRDSSETGNLALDFLRFNNDSGNNYYNSYKYARGAVFGTADNNFETYAYTYLSTSDPAFPPAPPTFTPHDIWILDYGHATHSKLVIRSMAMGTIDDRAYYYFRWKPGAQAPITSIQIGTFSTPPYIITNSSYELYGLK